MWKCETRATDTRSASLGADGSDWRWLTIFFRPQFNLALLLINKILISLFVYNKVELPSISLLLAVGNVWWNDMSNNLKCEMNKLFCLELSFSREHCKINYLLRNREDIIKWAKWMGWMWRKSISTTLPCRVSVLLLQLAKKRVDGGENSINSSSRKWEKYRII